DADQRHNLERCEVMGTEGRFVLDNCFEELTLYPRRGEELTVIRNSIMGGLTGFNATFKNRIGRWLEQISAGVPRDQIEASGEDDDRGVRTSISAACSPLWMQSGMPTPR